MHMQLNPEGQFLTSQRQLLKTIIEKKDKDNDLLKQET